MLITNKFLKNNFKNRKLLPICFQWYYNKIIKKKKQMFYHKNYNSIIDFILFSYRIYNSSFIFSKIF